MAEDTSAEMPRWRFVLGLASFFLAFAPHVVLGLLIVTGAGASAIATFAAISFTLNKVFLLLSVVLLGRPGFNRLKQHAVGVFRRHAMPDEVGPVRYGIGLVLFVVPLVFAWKAPYVTELMPTIGRHSTTAAIVTDVMLLVSLFVLGGSFWDKLRALFVRSATVVFPAR